MHKCPACGTEFEGGFCPECGAKWSDERRCPNCGAALAAGAKFCPECGNAFSAPSASFTPAQRVSESSEAQYAAQAANGAPRPMGQGDAEAQLKLEKKMKAYIRRRSCAKMCVLSFLALLIPIFPIISLIGLLCSLAKGVWDWNPAQTGKVKKSLITIVVFGVIGTVLLAILSYLAFTRLYDNILNMVQSIISNAAGESVDISEVLPSDVTSMLKTFISIYGYVWGAGAFFCFLGFAVAITALPLGGQLKKGFFGKDNAILGVDSPVLTPEELHRNNLACRAGSNPALKKRAKHTGLDAILLSAVALTLAAIVIVVCVLFGGGTGSAFSVKTLEKISIGDSQEEVRSVLGEPDYGEDGDYYWMYYDSTLKSYQSKMESLEEKYYQAMEDLDTSKMQSLMEEAMELEEKMENSTYKLITVTFDSSCTVYNLMYDTAWSASASYYSSDSSSDGKEVKSISFPEELTSKNYSKYAAQIYYTDGSYQLTVVPSSALSGVSVTDYGASYNIEWSDSYATYSATVTVAEPSSSTPDSGSLSLSNVESISMGDSQKTVYTLLGDPTYSDEEEWVYCDSELAGYYEQYQSLLMQYAAAMESGDEDLANSLETQLTNLMLEMYTQTFTAAMVEFDDDGYVTYVIYTTDIMAWEEGEAEVSVSSVVLSETTVTRSNYREISAQIYYSDGSYQLDWVPSSAFSSVNFADTGARYTIEWSDVYAEYSATVTVGESGQSSSGEYDESGNLYLENLDAYEWELSNGVYYSTNHADSSESGFRLTAVADGELTLSYGVSSEGYDIFYIIYYSGNSSSYIDEISSGIYIDEISGTSSYEYSITLSLAAGDYIEFYYSKDGSVSSGDDCAHFSFTFTVPTPVSAEGEESADGYVYLQSLTSGYEWIASDSTVYSTNHDDGSTSEFKLTALDDIELSLTYGVSSEYGDLFAIWHYASDGTRIATITGGIRESGDYKTTVSMSAGDYLLFRYAKDDSNSEGDDRGWFRYSVIRYISTEGEWDGEDILLVSGSESYEWAVTDGVYYSTNHGDGSNYFALIAYADMQLTLTYGVSSTSSSDRLYITHYSGYLTGDYSLVETIANYATYSSGEVTVTVCLAEGDYLVFQYVSGSSVGTDRGYFSYTYELKDFVYGEYDEDGYVYMASVSTARPWSVSNGVYDANTAASSAFTLTAEEEMQLTLSYAAGYNYLTVYHYSSSGNQIAELLYVCGEEGTVTVNMAAGDYLYCYCELYNTASACTVSYTYALKDFVYGEYAENGSVYLESDSQVYPWEYADGVYYSTNHEDSSVSEFTLTAQTALTVSLSCGVSSETSNDKFYITQYDADGETVDVIVNGISGTSSSTWTGTLSAGEYIVFRYSKNSSVSEGSDRAYFSYTATRTVYEETDSVLTLQSLTTGSEWTTSDGVYYSTNHAADSMSEFKLTASAEAELALTYGVSSRSGYDKFYIYHYNSDGTLTETIADGISGTNSNSTTVTLAGGDYLLFSYVRYNSATNSGDDRGWFSYTVTSVYVDVIGDTILAYNNGTVISTDSTNYAWTESDGTYTSGNAGVNNSYSYLYLTATSSVSVSFSYSVSSESGYDELYIRKYSAGSSSYTTIVDGISGTNSGSTTVTLAAGEYLCFYYSKDGSQHHYDDCATVSNISVTLQE